MEFFDPKTQAVQFLIAFGMATFAGAVAIAAKFSKTTARAWIFGSLIWLASFGGSVGIAYLNSQRQFAGKPKFACFSPKNAFGDEFDCEGRRWITKRSVGRVLYVSKDRSQHLSIGCDGEFDPSKPDCLKFFNAYTEKLDGGVEATCLVAEAFFPGYAFALPDLAHMALSQLKLAYGEPARSVALGELAWKSSLLKVEAERRKEEERLFCKVPLAGWDFGEGHLEFFILGNSKTGYFATIALMEKEI